MDIPEWTAHDKIVLPLVAAGWSNAEIAKRLRVSEESAKYRVVSALHRTGARNRVHLAAIWTASQEAPELVSALRTARATGRKVQRQLDHVRQIVAADSPALNPHQLRYLVGQVRSVTSKPGSHR